MLSALPVIYSEIITGAKGGVYPTRFTMPLTAMGSENDSRDEAESSMFTVLSASGGMPYEAVSG